jgi:hypothetical protein
MVIIIFRSQTFPSYLGRAQITMLAPLAHLKMVEIERSRGLLKREMHALNETMAQVQI